METYPEARSKNPDAVAALKEGVTVNQARLGIWNSPKIGDQHGTLVDADWSRLIKFFVDQKVFPSGARSCTRTRAVNTAAVTSVASVSQ